MSYAGSMGASLLRSAILGRGAYNEGKARGEEKKVARTAAQAAAAREERELAARIALQAQQGKAAERQAELVDPNSEDVLRRREEIETGGHRQRRAFDAANPIPGSGTTGPDRAADRMRSAYKAKLMAPTPSRYPGGSPAPGMSESEAESITTQAWGPPGDAPPNQPTTSSVMAGSILRGGGAAAPYRGKSAAATSTSQPGVKTSSARAPSEAVRVPPKLAATDARAAVPSAMGDGKEREMAPADLWDKKVDEGMSPAQATAYVHRIKGTG